MGQYLHVSSLKLFNIGFQTSIILQILFKFLKGLLADLNIAYIQEGCQETKNYGNAFIQDLFKAIIPEVN